MRLLPEAFERVVHELKKLPSIGEKTATRLAFHILTSKRVDPHAMALAIGDLRDKVHACPICGFFTDEPLCVICTSRNREDHALCIVEQPNDLIALDQSGGFKGRYHVLGGVLDPINGITPKELRIDALLERVSASGITEVVLALGTSLAGEVTASFVARLLQGKGVRVTQIARGVPSGSGLEYLDASTLERALSGRQEV